MKVNFRAIIICCLLSIGLLTGRAQQTHQVYLEPTRYLLSLPDGYEKDKTANWPLILYLHGSGEIGTELDTLKLHSLPRFIEKGRKLSAIVVSPQIENRDQGGWDIDLLYHFLQGLKKTYRIDQDRIYLTGASLGGYATWDMGEKHPEEFAAIVPVCGAGDTVNIWKLRYMPVWSFHGALDKNVPIELDRKAVNALKKYNPGVRFSVYPNVAHNIWNVAYQLDSLYDWLLQQKRFSYKQVDIAPEILQQYNGIYLSSGKDTINIKASDGLLFINNDKTGWKPASKDLFFKDKRIIWDMRFIRDDKGTVRSILFMGIKKDEFKKME